MPEHSPGQQRKLEAGYIQKVQACYGRTTSKQKLWIPYSLEDFDKHTEIALEKKKKGAGGGGPSLGPHENCVQHNHDISEKVSK